MVQRLAEVVHLTLPAERIPERVDQIVQDIFLDTQVEKDTHFKFIRDYLLEGNPKLRQTLKTYLSVLKGEKVPYDDRSAIHARLRLAGAVARYGRRLVPRNRIYEKVFDAAWATDNMPRNKAIIVAVTSSSALVLVLLWFLIVQPLYFPKFTRSQQFYYTEESTFHFRQTIQSVDNVSKVTLDGRELSWMPVAQLPLLQLRPLSPATIDVNISDLDPGFNTHVVRIYTGIWQEHFETTLTIVYFPKVNWKVPSSLEMVLIPAGCFKMGCWNDSSGCSGDEKPARRVCLEAFEIGRYEVTQDQWVAVMGGNPSYFKFKEEGGQHPVETVSWDDAREFIRRLNELTGKNYRLPTEAEWEYAARSGGKNQTYAGGEILDELGWYVNNSKSRTHYPVGRKKPNRLGLYDMSGNVKEWVEDDYHPTYEGAPTDGRAWVEDPRAPDRVVRGGSFMNIERASRSTERLLAPPDFALFELGFRLSRSLGP
jgi:formylglycine-generating enzyme required for sulfatase activity